MLDTINFSMSDASALQVLAFIGFGIATIAFFAWVAYLTRQ